MIGTILRFDPAQGGLLRGEDGRRYAFDPAAWQDSTAPIAGMRVDFEPDGDEARSLCALPPGRSGAAPRHFLAERPGLPLAVLILLACFLPFLTLGPISANLFNVVEVASSLGQYAPVNVNMETGLWLFHGLYVVPVLAVALFAFEWRGLAGRWTRIGIGLAGLVAPVAIALGARALFTATPPPSPAASLGRELLRRVREHVPTDLFVPQIGIGWIAIALLSLVLVLTGIFWSSPMNAGATDDF